MVRRFSKACLFLLLLILTFAFTSCIGLSTTLTSTSTPTRSLIPTGLTQTTVTKPTSTPTPTNTPIPISWESMGGPSGGRISKLIQNPYGRHELYALTVRGIYKSEDKGESWQLIDKSDSIGANSIAVYEDRLFVAGYDGAYCFQGNNSLSKIFNQGCFLFDGQ